MESAKFGQASLQELGEPNPGEVRHFRFSSFELSRNRHNHVIKLLPGLPKECVMAFPRFNDVRILHSHDESFFDLSYLTEEA